MKSSFCACLAGALLLSACSQKSDAPAAAANAVTNTPSSSSSPLDAPANYLGALAKAQQTAIKTVDTASIDKAIQLFAVENGRNPKDLNELVAEKFLPKIPDAPYGTKLVYDANTGKVKVVNQ